MNKTKFQQELMKIVMKSSSLDYNEAFQFVRTNSPSLSRDIQRLENKKEEDNKKKKNSSKTDGILQTVYPEEI